MDTSTCQDSRLTEKIANHTQVPYERGDRAEVYLLGKAPDNTTSDYFLCAMKAGITTSCTTHYNASSGGQSLEAVCDDENGKHSDDAAIQPLRSNGDTAALVSWRDLGFNLLNSLSLNNGVFDGDASTARILTQLQLTEPKLNKTLPSPAEALLSMTTCTVLDLTQNFPFQPFWDTMAGEFDTPQMQYFNASVRVAQYMSGGEKSYQKVRRPSHFSERLTNPRLGPAHCARPNTLDQHLHTNLLRRSPPHQTYYRSLRAPCSVYSRVSFSTCGWAVQGLAAGRAAEVRYAG